MIKRILYLAYSSNVYLLFLQFLTEYLYIKLDQRKEESFFFRQIQDSLAQTCFVIIFLRNSTNGGDDRKSLSFNHDQQTNKTPRRKIKIQVQVCFKVIY